jgi:hypothetical protein
MSMFETTGAPNRACQEKVTIQLSPNLIKVAIVHDNAATETPIQAICGVP